MRSNLSFNRDRLKPVQTLVPNKVDLISRLQRPVLTIYMAWMAVLLVRAVVVFTGSEWLATLQKDTFDFVIALFSITTVTLVVLGAVLAWFADAGHSWASWCFMGLCGLYAVDCLLGTLAVGPLYESMLRPYGLFRGPISFMAWLGLLWLAWPKRVQR
jgi:hypothetical protein